MEVGALRSGDPERLGSYALIGRVGEGGQGTVYLGEDEDGLQVAIKLLHDDLTEDDKARARFLRELDVAKQVAPFCTAQVIDADATGDRPYIVSEYVRGPSVHQQVAKDGPLEGAALDRLAVGTATALAAIHQADIIHRDFKPHNVLLGPDGPRVIDFGVARALSAGTTLTSRVIGTPSYMSPEQIGGDEVERPSDVFCWAATLVYAATGEPPFGQDTIPAVINRILHEEPDLGDMDGTLRDLVADCLAKEPERRPQARQVLMRLLGHEEAPAPVAVPDEVAADPDATAMLAAGSVRAAAAAAAEAAEVAAAAEAADEEFGDPVDSTPDLAAFEEDAPAPLDRTQAVSAGTLPGQGRSTLRQLVESSGRSAALAGAAALFVAVIVVSSVMFFSSGENGKAGQRVGDPTVTPASDSNSPTMSDPTTTLPMEPLPEDTPSYTPDPSYDPEYPGSPTTSGSPSTTGSPTTGPSDTASPDDPGTGDGGGTDPGTGDGGGTDPGTGDGGGTDPGTGDGGGTDPGTGDGGDTPSDPPTGGGGSGGGGEGTA